MLRWELHLRKASMYINGGHQDEEFMLSNLTTALNFTKNVKKGNWKKYILGKGLYKQEPRSGLCRITF
jgi:hypothetical protein